MNKMVFKGIAAGLALAASASVMAGEGAANVSVTSDYLWRAQTQTNNAAAIQGGYDYDFGNGVSVGTWLSNVEPGVEYDFYGSYSGTSGDFGYTVGYIYYGYTDAALTSFSEPYVGVSYKDFSLDYYIGDGYNYMDLGYGTTVAEIDLGLNYGMNSTTGGVADSTSLTLSVGKDFSGYGVALTYGSFTLKGTDAVTATALSVTKEF